jgi:hypothetical protein
MSVGSKNLRPSRHPHFALDQLIVQKPYFEKYYKYNLGFRRLKVIKNEEKFNFALTTSSLISYCSIFLARRDGESNDIISQL